MATNTTTMLISLLLFLFLYLSSLDSALAQERPTNISRGSILTPIGNSTWLSRSGRYAFGFYPRPAGGGFSVGVFIAGIPEKTVVWTANREDPPLNKSSTLLLTNDGKLILQGQDKLIVDPPQPDSIWSASMLDSGNFVLYNSNGDIIWQSFDHPTNTILPGQRLSANQSLFCSISDRNESAGIFYLIMQSDGNLVQYSNGPNGRSNPYYASETYLDGDKVTLNLDDDGTLYLMNGYVLLKNLTTENPSVVKIFEPDSIYLAKIDPNGIFPVYSHPGARGEWSVSWESSTDRCHPPGLCGLNGFCELLDENVDCKCLPGFVFVEPGNWAFGCRRNFTAPSCEDLNGTAMTFTMEEEKNTIWDEASYSDISLLTKEACQDSCLEDCNCEAAFFKEGHCRKQRLPLTYGRRDSSDTTTTLIKVGAPSEKLGSIPKLWELVCIPDF